MDNVRAHLISVLVNIVHVEIFGNGTVKLNGDHGVFLAVYILRLNIDLGPVKGGFTVGLREGNAILCEDFPDLALGGFPILLVPQIFLPVVGIPPGEAVGHLVLEPQGGQAVHRQIQTPLQLLPGLVRTDDQMAF